MIAGLDSSSEPSAQQIAAAFAGGVRVWGGYIGAGAYHDWSPATFHAVRAAGMGAIAYAFPQTNPLDMRAQAGGDGALLCLDNALGDAPNPYAPAVASWLAAARQGGPAGLYGQPAVLNYWRGHYDFAVVCGSGNSSSNNPMGLSVPCGNQYWNTHSEYGMSVDRGIYDPWFQQTGPAPAPLPPTEDDNMPGQGYWNGATHTAFVDAGGVLTQVWVTDDLKCPPPEAIATGFRPGGASVEVGPKLAIVSALNAKGHIQRYAQVIGQGGWKSLDNS